MKNYFQAPWTLKQVKYTLLVAFLLLNGAFLLLYYLPEKSLVDEKNILHILIMFLLQWGTVIISFLLFAPKSAYKLKSWLIEKIGIGKSLKIVIANFFLYMAISTAITMLIVYTGWKIPGYQVQESIFEMFGTDTLSIVVAGILIVILAPIIEEFIFRGFLLQPFVDKFGIILGSIITATIFAGFHLEPQSFIPLFILGLIMNGIVIRHKNLIPSIAFHIFNNALAFTVQILILQDIISIDRAL